MAICLSQSTPQHSSKKAQKKALYHILQGHWQKHPDSQPDVLVWRLYDTVAMPAKQDCKDCQKKKTFGSQLPLLEEIYQHRQSYEIDLRSPFFFNFQFSIVYSYHAKWEIIYLVVGNANANGGSTPSPQMQENRFSLWHTWPPLTEEPQEGHSFTPWFGGSSWADLSGQPMRWLFF